MAEEGESFLQRLGVVHRALHTDGSKLLARIVATCIEMLADRGEEEVRASPEPLAEAVAGRPVVWSETTNVFLHTEDRVGVKFARAVLEAHGDKKAVCVSIDGPTPFTRHEFESRAMQFMTCKSLCSNVTQHQLVPRHRLVAEADVPYEKSALALIAAGDPIVQYYDWPVGGVVKIERVHGGSEPTTYFRLIASS